MRSLNQRFGLIGPLSLSLAMAVAGIAAATTPASPAQFNNFAVGARGGGMSPSISPSLRSDFRSEPRFQRFNNNAPDDLDSSDKPKVKTKRSKVSTGDSGSKRPSRGKHPPGHYVPVVGTGVVVGAPGPAGAGTPQPSPGATVAQRGGIVIPPANENRFVKDEVVLEFAANAAQPGVAQLLARHGLIQLERLDLTLTSTTLVRARIANHRPVRIALQRLGGEVTLLAAQANYLYRGSQQQNALPKVAPAVATAAALPSAGDPAQYVLEKLHLNEAHSLATGDKVLVAVIDSSIDIGHPELKGVIAGSFDALGKPEKPHMHGTAIAGAIAAHARLMGAAPAARILAIRAFGNSGNGAEATTVAIRKGVEYAAAQHARIVNMSFAGPSDPGVSRSLAAAKGQGMVLIAASGNFGPKSGPQYPAADPNVIAVSATDANDHLFRSSNIGPHIAVTAPGVDVLLPVPANGYELISGTSFSAAYVSGIAALLIQRAPGLSPDAVRNILETTAKDIGPRGKDPEFGAGLVDAYQAIVAAEASATPSPPQAVSEQVKPQ